MITRFLLIIALIGCTLNGYSQLPGTWTFNPASYNYSMTLTAYINHDCVELMDDNNAVGAFVGGQCRGFAYTDVNGNGHKLAFLTIYSNNASNEAVELRFFKATTNQEFVSIDGTVFLSDAIKGSVAAPFVVTTNHKPTAIAVTNLGVQENTPLGGNIGVCSGTDQDVTQTLNFSLPIGALENNQFLISGNNLQLNTVLNYSLQSSYQISIQVNDGFGCTLIDTFTVTVDDNAFAPVAANDATSLDEGSSIGVDVLANDTDYDNDIDTSSVQVMDAPNHGTATVVNGLIHYVPNANYFGFDTLQYRVCDLTNTGALCDDAFLFIVVDPIPNGPVANLDAVTTLEDTPKTISVLSNDTDIENDINPNSMVIIDGPNHGSAVITSGVINYTPIANFHGIDTVIYSVCDQTVPTALCDTAYIIIQVTSVPDKPVSANDLVTLNENDTLAISVLVNDTDIDNDIDPSTVQIIDAPNHGTATVLNGVVTYIATTNYNGPDTLTYKVCDLSSPVSLCDTALIIFNIIPIPNPPFANQDTITILEEGIALIPVLLNDTDIENDINPNSIQIISVAHHGNASVLSNSIQYIPNGQYNGVDTLTYSVCDMTTPTPQCDTAFVIIKVIATPDTPITFFVDGLSVIEDNALNTFIGTISTLDADIDLPNDSFTYTLVAGANDSDNKHFYIVADQLYINTRTIYEIKNVYHIRLRTTDTYGLFIEKEFDVNVTDQVGNKITLPASTYISNNNDGKNDYFTIENVTIYDAFTLTIFDQFGKAVFTQPDHYNNDFNGKINGEPLPSGTYYYVFKSEEVTYSGNITIVN